jgi:hypothetical protein
LLMILQGLVTKKSPPPYWRADPVKSNKRILKA